MVWQPAQALGSSVAISWQKHLCSLTVLCTAEAAYHGVVLLQNLQVVYELVLLLSHTLVVHPVEVPLLAELVPGIRCLDSRAVIAAG